MFPYAANCPTSRIIELNNEHGAESGFCFTACLGHARLPEQEAGYRAGIGGGKPHPGATPRPCHPVQLFIVDLKEVAGTGAQR